MNDLIELLDALPPTAFRRVEGAPDSAIDEIETVNKIKVPDDLRAALCFSDGFSLRSPKTNMTILPTAELAWHSMQPHFKDGLPGLLILGTDGEGSVFYVDPNNLTGRGANRVYLVRMSDLDIPSSMLVGETFTEVVRTLANETDIYERPELRNEPRETSKPA